ncbi:hypothetical protein K435DRAFT_871532 [Dendrothele bispora CBS 962.96]|uniref:Uncharacterized protein n=1 Tax=Dendrothele bispora (strain CBS 962.96) TaxID=1314807 RepID=A0A4S8L497_DENBC|nr:hypothetical protein K435DRAFT_871532 [Dendrothele bispora CBS 962.96]
MCTSELEPEIHAGLKNISSDDENEEGEEEERVGEDSIVDIPLPTFDEITQEIMQESDELEEDEDIFDSQVLTLAEIFDYPPSRVNDNSFSFSFMTEYWWRGESTLSNEMRMHKDMTSDLINELHDPDLDDDVD